MRASRQLLRFATEDNNYYPLDIGVYLTRRIYGHERLSVQLIDAIYHHPENSSLGIPLESELHAAHIAARLPILTVIGAEERLPKVLLDKNTSEKLFINTVLDVRWRRVFGVFAVILAWQWIAIALSVFWCRKIIVPDPISCLSVARLLRTAMVAAGGRSLVLGKELAGYMEDKDIRRMRYGTRKSKEHNAYEVDLWHDVKNFFPDGKKYL